MKTIKIDAHAKVNLSLDVLGRRRNGYHELSMIMQEISLKDVVTIKEIDDNNNKVEISCSKKEVPTDEKNIVYSAFKLLSKKYNIDKSISIFIEKNIPISGGLAGGSTDAAAVLKGLNQIWDLGLTKQELMDLGVEIGADVPFCIMGGTALSEGIGEKLTAITPFKDKLLLLANPDIEVSTEYVYKNLDLKNLKDRPDIKKIISYIEQGDTRGLSRNMRNVLESVTIKKYSEIEDIKEKMMNHGALGSLMSGSGATVFGIFDNDETLNECKTELKKTMKTVVRVVTI